ncbi:hypothetical protein MFLO_11385 [Listeria floridensis FSL S10-1187]|uniref:Uncharacterized protein n=1 Tax=Listeria floridensis FSL S10-1187 TaxID=1265817 RepID=A0ABP3AYT9_9LIST|nr:hypothetical protein MFLO_11385 [Listeria floridensis FSL S10-1187]
MLGFIMLTPATKRHLDAIKRNYTGEIKVLSGASYTNLTAAHLLEKMIQLNFCLSYRYYREITVLKFLHDVIGNFKRCFLIG